MLDHLGIDDDVLKIGLKSIVPKAIVENKK